MKSAIMASVVDTSCYFPSYLAAGMAKMATSSFAKASQNFTLGLLGLGTSKLADA